MAHIIVATHGQLAQGLLDSLEMIVGSTQGACALCLQRDDSEGFDLRLKTLIDEFETDEQVFILTDVLGSSVTNAAVELAAQDARLKVISGVNLPLLLSVALEEGTVSEEALVEVLRDARKGLRDASVPMRETQKALDKHPAQGAKSTICLTRLDYRLLHGQVVFSWVSHVGANRIVIVDDAAANDEFKKNALKLAKPTGVHLNIFTLERALSKMEKFETLGDRAMFIFGNAETLAAFLEKYPKISEVNYGATANTDGALQVGESVFLDRASQEATKKILGLGVKIFVQQTPNNSLSYLETL